MVHKRVANILGQYYNFLRLGMSGYRRIVEALRDLADDLLHALRAATDFLAKNPPRGAAKPGFSHT